MGVREQQHTAESTGTKRRNRVLAAAVAANSIEWYDFLIYGTAASLVINTHFFPAANPTVGVLASFATFAVGFAGRPIGAAVFGHFGDRFGRKPALLTAMLMMALSSTLIGLLPTYASIGVAAPVILVVLRIAQGIAVGGQWGGATLLAVEHAPPNRRALFGAIPQLGLPIGMITGTLIFLVLSGSLSADQFSAWGWRVPFLISVLMFPLAYYIHHRIEDSPQFKQAEAALRAQAGERRRSSVIEVLRRPKAVLLITAMYAANGIAYYLVVTGSLDYGTREVGAARSTMLLAVMISMVTWTLSMLFFAYLCDRTGRPRLIYAASQVFNAVWVFALFPLVRTGETGLIILALAVAQVGVGACFGPAQTMFADMFPPSVRYSGASLGYQLANIFGSAPAPLIMVAILAATGSTVWVSVYAGGMALLALIPLAFSARVGQVVSPKSPLTQ